MSDTFTMRRSLVRVALAFSCAVAPILAEIVYVTDLPIFTSLAPCAASALSQNIQWQTSSACPAAVTALQSCVCQKNDNFASISTAISKSVSYSCSSTASEDQSSAFAVYSAYCNQGATVTFPTPTNPVTNYITDIPALSQLAPCASSAVSAAVMYMTDLCPADPAALATCVCSKNQNSLRISQSINSGVRTGCSSHSDDITSAQSVFAAFCLMNNGTTSFPTPTNPPGDMTYFISALPQFQSLAPCAQSGVSSAMNSLTYYLCPSGPQALASCACIKSSMFGSMTSIISSDVTDYCSSTATEDVASALKVFDFYCSAAKGLVTASGVSDSIAQTYATFGSGGTGGGNGGGAKTTAKQTGTAGPQTGSPQSTSGPSTGLIAGVVVGVVAVLGLIGAGLFFFMRSVRRRKAAAALAAENDRLETTQMPPHSGTPELGGNPSTASPFPPPPPSPSPSTVKNGMMDPHTASISPVSAGSPYTAPPQPDRPELQGHGSQLAVPGQQQQQQQQPQAYGQPHPQAAEAYGQQVYEFPTQGTTVYHADSRPVQQTSELHGMSWQSGPVQGYHELDGYGQAPHAR